jgi:hypothetical protein
MDIFKRVNIERKHQKLSQLTLDSYPYKIAKNRAMEIIWDFSHNGCPGGYGENIAKIPLGRVIGLGHAKYRTGTYYLIRNYPSRDRHSGRG